MNRTSIYSKVIWGIFIFIIPIVFVFFTPMIGLATHTDPGAFAEDPRLDACNHCHNLTIIAGNFDGTDRRAAFSPGNAAGFLDNHPKMTDWMSNVNFMVSKGSPSTVAAIDYLNTFYTPTTSCPTGIPEGVSCDLIIPVAPSNLSASVSGWTTAVAYTTIDLLWNDNSGGDETGFRIERCMGSGCSGFTTIATVGPNITTFSDPGLAMNTVYNYQIVAEGTGGDSAPSNASEAQTGPDSGPPSQPANVVGVADIAGCFIELTWDPSSDDIKVVGYNIYRDSDPTPIATVSGTSYIDGGLDPGITYTYEVEAFDPAGNFSARGLSGMVTSNPGCTIGGGGAVERAIVSWSTRNFVSTGDNITIEGFVVDGSDPKRILIKGLGPSLGDFGVPTPLSNPRIELYAGAVLVAANDDWGTTNPLCGAPVILCEGALAIQGTGQDPCAGGGTGCNQEAALLVTLPPGDYSVFLRGVSGGTGIGLVETVDLDLVPSSILNNAATRGLVQTADGIMIGSLNVGGANPATFLIRGRGPSLGSSPFNLSGVLADPDLSLLSGTTVIAQNNDWGTNDPTCGAPAIYCYSDTAINQLGFDPCTPNPGESLPPPNCAVESALLVTLPPGVYPIFLRGNLGGTGLGLIEVFHISTKVLANIATRSFFGTGDQVSIVGFYIEGIVPKEVVIRGRGISMAGPPFNISGTVSDPNLRIFDNASASYIAQNDDWGTPDPTSLCNTSGFTCGTAADITALGLDPCVPNPGESTSPAGCEKESALKITLPPGGYAAIVNGVGGTTGIGLAEVFDVDGNVLTSVLSNISTRTWVGTSNFVAIAGAYVSGSTAKLVVVRGRGPSMAAAPFNIPGTLSNPKIRIFENATASYIAENDNWQTPDPLCATSGNLCLTPAEITATGLDPCQPNPGESVPPPDCASEAVVGIILKPGGYSFVLSGVSTSTGIGLIEAFAIE